MLKQPLPGAARATLGVSLALALSLGTGYVAWASQPARASEAAPVLASAPGTAAMPATADTTPISYARLAPPKYPADALAEKAQGTVMLRVLVDVLGAPAQVEIETSSGDDRLDQAAAAKVRQDWRFNPLMKDGKPEQQWVLVPITFSLDGPPTADEAISAAANQLDEIYIAPKQ